MLIKRNLSISCLFLEICSFQCVYILNQQTLGYGSNKSVDVGSNNQYLRFRPLFQGKLQRGIKNSIWPVRPQVMVVSFGHGGIPENVLFFRKKHLPSNQASIQNASIAKNVRCGRDYICAKCYALIPFCSIFTNIWWTRQSPMVPNQKNRNLFFSSLNPVNKLETGLGDKQHDFNPTQ